MEKYALWKSTEFSSTKDVRTLKLNTDTTSELLKPKIVEDVPGKLFEGNSWKQNTTISVLKKYHH